MCSSDFLLNFNWRVAEDLEGSGHYSIVLGLPEDVPSPRVPHWQVYRADWDSFHSLSKVARSIEESEGEEEAVAYFTNFLLWFSEQSIP